MAPATSLADQLYEAAFRHAVTLALVGVLVLFLLGSLLRGARRERAKQAPSIPETIPWVSNSLQYMTDLPGFCQRAAEALRKSNTSIATFRLLGRPMFLVAGGSNAQALFRTNTGLTADTFILIIIKVLWDPSKEDFARFAADRSGRLKNPAPGWENIPAKDRLWASWHHICAEYLTRGKPTNDLAAMYFRLFSQKLSRFPLGEWTDLQVIDLVGHMAESAAVSLCGRRLFEMNPDLFDVLDDFEAALTPLVFGLPRWLNPKPYRARDRWMEMNRKFMEEALRTFDWDGPEAKAEWSDTFGAPFQLELLRWALDAGLSVQTISGIWGVQTLNLNINTVPTVTWALMDMLKAGPGLIKRVQEEAETAILIDPQTGERRFDVQKLLALPLLHAVYVETLRLHAFSNVLREATRDTTIDGYEVPKGAMVQALTLMAHYDNIWETNGHPPSEFWPDRYLNDVEKTDEEGNKIASCEFTMGNRNPYWFPYGGGVSMCPGRHFAKQEIMMTIAIFTTMFDIQFVEWTMPDGSPSDREPRHVHGFISTLPDRDLKVRVRRRW